MFDLDPLKNLMLAAVGAVSYSQEKMSETINSLIERGQLSREQGEKVISEWVDRGKSEQENLSSKFTQEFESFIKKLPVVSRQEFEELEARVVASEARLAALEKPDTPAE